jgi:hypothetical protein
MARLLYPHAGIADDVYAEVIDDVLSAAAEDPSLRGTLDDAVTELNATQRGDWFEIDQEDQIRAMKAVEDQPFFVVIQASVRDRFYTHPRVWEHISYPGSSAQRGGYVHRGFDDIDWLPKDK